MTVRNMESLYQPLLTSESIRLVKLNRGAAHPVCGELISTPLKAAPSFFALSFTWGNQKQSSSVTLNGIHLPITPGLAAGLQKISSNHELHTRYAPEYIWIDQICINQNDSAERSQQVQLMDQIYTKSQRTIVWLGIDEGSAQSAVSLIQRIDDIHREEQPSIDQKRHQLSGMGESSVDEKRHDRLGLPDINGPEWKSMSHFLSRRWFQRAWAVQEIVLSTEEPIVLCGDVICSWESIAWAADWLQKHAYRLRGLVPSTSLLIHRTLCIRQNLTTCSVAALILYGTAFVATDPRDNLWSLLGIMNRKCAREGKPSVQIRTDYTLSVTEAHQLALRQILLFSNSLSVLNAPGSPLRGCFDLYRCFGRQLFWRGRPSWLPHFQPQIRPPSFSTVEMYRTQEHLLGNYSAARGLPVSIEELPNEPSVLCLKGVRVSPVVRCLGICLAPHTARGLHEWSILDRFWLRLVKMHELSVRWRKPQFLHIWRNAVLHGRYTQPLDTAWALLHATTAGTDLEFRPWTRDDLAHFCAFVSNMNDSLSEDGPTDRLRQANRTIAEFARANSGDAQRYADTMLDWCKYRRFFITGSGLFGIGPSSMRQDDVVCVLFGGKVPYVLRPRKDHWLFVGDCYVHELGEGQAIEELRKGKLCEEYFRLH